MNSLQFKKKQFKKLSHLLGFPVSKLEYITNHIDDYYKEWFEEKRNNETGEIKRYKDGTIKKRVIRPSLSDLIKIQESIKKNTLDTISLPDNVHGGIKKKSNITNAVEHKGNKYQFTTDLQDFYPSVKHDIVYKTFLKLGVTQHFAHWLTKLTTWKYELPQGTKTSQALANLAFLETDYKIIAFCDVNHIKYTRYVDDLTFSSQQEFQVLLNDILLIIKEGGFKINYRKTRYKGNQTITGIRVFNNYIDAPEKLKLKSRAEHIERLEGKPFSNYVNSIRMRNRNMKKRNKLPIESSKMQLVSQ